MNAMSAPPTKTESMVFQLATPVTRRRHAPRAMAMTLVSPIEPGMIPVMVSMKSVVTATGLSAVLAASSPSGVAMEKASTFPLTPVMQSI